MKKDKTYVLGMFPYPSGEGLHVGHVRIYTAVDVMARYFRMKSFGDTQDKAEVLHPMGWDAFGLPAENAAIKAKKNPKDMVPVNEANFKRQMEDLSLNFDWDRTFSTTDPEYYAITQWIFLQLYNKKDENGQRLVYREEVAINWCPKCKTGLANEEVLPDGTHERCGTAVEKKMLPQWVMRITSYADRLLEDLDTKLPELGGKSLDWPRGILEMQRNWIGKKKGLEIDFELSDGKKVPIWTKFWETVYGTTFLVVSPEVVKSWMDGGMETSQEVSKYVGQALAKTELARQEGADDKTGVKLGVTAKNPVNNEEVLVFVADYVLANVGTGAVMGVPAHDERDFAFARKYKLPIRKVVDVQVEMHSIVIKKSVGENFADKTRKNNWYVVDYEGWAWGVVVPEREEDKYVKLVQESLRDGPWFVHTDGSKELVIYKEKVFDVRSDNKAVKEYGRDLDIPDEQMNWDDLDAYMFAHEKGGLIVNSGQFDGLNAWGEGKEKMAEWMIGEGMARWETTYHLRDWVFSRQRYWGEPIPLVYCPSCAEKYPSEYEIIEVPVRSPQGRDFVLGENVERTQLAEVSRSSEPTENDSPDLKSVSDELSALIKVAVVPVPESELPLELPDLESYEPTDTGESPLSRVEDWVNTKCPKCGGDARRETDTMPNWAGSCWYFLAYPFWEAKQKGEKIGNLNDAKRYIEEWMPVDWYLGGAEHAVLHLLYARFWVKVLQDLGIVSFSEPFLRLRSVGMVLAEDGKKMSKSIGNVINPDDMVKEFGSDEVRLYEMFMGPWDQSIAWETRALVGQRRFLERVRDTFTDKKNIAEVSSPEVKRELYNLLHRVERGIEEQKFNTSIAGMMEFVNLLREQSMTVTGEDGLMFAQAMSPFAPVAAQELWESLGGTDSVSKSDWPVMEEELSDEIVTPIVIQVNGKVRGMVEMSKGESEDEEKVVEAAMADERVKKWVESEPKKTIFVKGKLVNFVV